MSPGTLTSVLLGAGIGFGLLLAVIGLVGEPVRTSRRQRGPLARRIAAWRSGTNPVMLAAATGAGIVAYVLTGWPSAAILAALAVIVLPRYLGTDTAATREQARVEAVATWTEQLAGTLAAAAGLEQAIVAASTTAPAAISTPALGLAGRIKQGVRTPAALDTFAVEVADETCDLVCTALISASTGQAGNIADQLGQLALTARQRVDMRLRIGAERAKVRAQVRAVIIIVLVTVAGMCLAARSYLAPYSSPTGQLILLVVGGIFAAAFAWMRRLTRPVPGRRLFARTTSTEDGSR